MKKYGGGSYFPSGAPGREERREEDYPQGENQIWIEKTKRKTKNTKKRGGRRTIHKVRIKFRQKDNKKTKRREWRRAIHKVRIKLDYQLILELSLGDKTITLRQQG